MKGDIEFGTREAAQRYICSQLDLTEKDRESVFCPLCDDYCNTDCEFIIRSRYTWRRDCVGDYQVSRVKAECGYKSLLERLANK